MIRQLALAPAPIEPKVTGIDLRHVIGRRKHRAELCALDRYGTTGNMATGLQTMLRISSHGRQQDSSVQTGTISMEIGEAHDGNELTPQKGPDVSSNSHTELPMVGRESLGIGCFERSRRSTLLVTAPAEG